MGRPTKDAARKRKERLLETDKSRFDRLSRARNRMSDVRRDESQTKYIGRLAQMQSYASYKLKIETESQKIKRLSLVNLRISNETLEERDHRLSLIQNRLSNETPEEREHRISLIKNRLSNETSEEREHRISLIKNRLSNETPEVREHRISGMKRRRLNETSEDYDQRLKSDRKLKKEKRKLFGASDFKKAINIFCDVPCGICRKALYPQQRYNVNTTDLSTILPLHLVKLENIVACFRCSTSIKRRKIPSQAFWNKMELSSIPEELVNLSHIEQRLLCRIVPHIKIIKVHNKFSQDWCRGQVILFAQDVVELAEQLPLQLSQARIVIVAESLENIHHIRQLKVDIHKLKLALQWLITNNPLFHDVVPFFPDNIDIAQVAQIVDSESKNVEKDALQPNFNSRYTILSENVSIIRGTFNQGCERFDISSRGKQCTAIASIACVAFSISDANKWFANDVDYILLLGDRFYRECIAKRIAPNEMEANTEYLRVTELQPQVMYNNRIVNIRVCDELALNGHIVNDNPDTTFRNLENALSIFFSHHTCGILTANLVSVALCRYNNSDDNYFWLFDSHSRGPKGYKARKKGFSCCMRFKNILGLYKTLHRNLIAKTGNEHTLNIYTLTPLHVVERNTENQPTEADIKFQQMNDGNRIIDRTTHETTNIKEIDEISENAEIEAVFTTNMLHSIDDAIPNVESVITTNNNGNVGDGPVRLVDVKRKTAPPLNIERERRMEELCWYFLFPDGKNGFGEQREIPITPLDYFQARVMGSDRRFQRTDYMFFALSIVEYYRTKASVSVSCRMRQGDHLPQGLIDNMHLIMRNIRGSASYWRRACSELIAMVRTLGPPTWFMTFSCNDLNWLDMQEALLIADGRDRSEVKNLTFSEKLSLVQQYPVIVAKQFTIRVNALILYLKKNPECLGGAVIDLWYRIEFQNRGSPHLHLLVWCENVPDFSTQQGMEVINKVVSCSLNSENNLRPIVETVQMHKHTSTCYKDRNNSICRFGFPRPVSDRTVCLGPDETLANNGRFCILQRTEDEVMVNNYNPDLLNLWEGNMDLQPCGSVTAVAYYVAKYVSKCEPNEAGDVVKEAIQKAKRRGGNVWNQLFYVSMAILSMRLISAPECAYRLCHLPLKMSSRKSVFVNSCKPDERYRILRLEGDEASTFNNIFDRYIERPNELEDLSLAEFAVRYEYVSHKVWKEDDGDIELNEHFEKESSRYITLRNGTRMQVRNKLAVLRTRYYTLNSDREAYYYSLIVCHIPFRNEKELLLRNESAENCFIRRQHELKPLLENVTTEEFAHIEQVIQQALAQAVALNIGREATNKETNDEYATHADEHIIQDLDNLCEKEEEISGISTDQFVSGVRSLNVQQKNLFEEVTAVIEKDMKGDEVQMLQFITGGAGSGKSFTLKLLVEHVKRCYGPTVDALVKPQFIEVAALTGVAARQIFGKTLHSVFSLSIEKGRVMAYRKMTGQRLEQERRKWRYIKWLIIDEISMVSYENMRAIHLRLQEFKDNDKLFGGMNILLFGDIMQLPPVKGNWCFHQPSWCAAEIHLWHQFSYCELTTNMRQQDDVEFVDLLNNLRFGELTTVQLELLCERRNVELMGDFADGSVVRIYPTIKLVDEYNYKMTNIIAKSSRVYDISAVDESREPATYGKNPPSNVIPSDVNNCGGLLHTIKLSKGSRVMLRRNISISDGLVNGAMGVVEQFKWPAMRKDQLEVGELPETVMIKFDDVTVGVRVKDSNGLVGVTPVNTTFQATKGYGDVERRMLPIILSWAVTVHKLQGVTLNRAVIDLGKNLFAKGQAYVALSRVKTLDGIAISDLDSNKLLKNPHDVQALTEMQRLRNLPRKNVV